MLLSPRARDVSFCLGATLLSPIWLLVIGTSVAVVWLYAQLDEIFGAKESWSNWYAWYPLRVRPDSHDVVWLEWVERCRWYGLTIYRRPGDTRVRSMDWC